MLYIPPHVRYYISLNAGNHVKLVGKAKSGESVKVPAHETNGNRIVRCVVLTLSDETSANHDGNGNLIESILHEAGHEVVWRRVVKTGSAAIREELAEALADDECDVVITSGGTGLCRKLEAYETLTALYEKQLPHFGSLLTTLVFQDSGSVALHFRPSAGVIERHLIFSLPDDHTIIRLALEKLILPELSKLLTEVRN